MPYYTSRCESCGKRYEYVRKVAERNDTPLCCDRATAKLLDTPMVGALAGLQGFVAEGTREPQWIETGADLKRYMSTNDFVSSTEGAQEAAIRREARAVETEYRIDAAISKAIAIHS